FVRGRAGLGDLADLLHRVQGRGPGAVPRARRAVRPGGDPRQRAVPGSGEYTAADRAVRRRPRTGGAPPGACADGPVRRTGGDRRRGRVPGQRRRLVHHRLDVPGRRRHLGRLRDAPLARWRAGAGASRGLAPGEAKAWMSLWRSWSYLGMTSTPLRRVSREAMVAGEVGGAQVLSVRRRMVKGMARSSASTDSLYSEPMSVSK